MNTTNNSNQAINWRQVGLFLALTFLLSWGANLVLALTGGYGSQNTGILLQLQMLIPAFSAILLSLFVFQHSPLHFRTYRGRPRLFLYAFLIYTVIYMVLAGLAVTMPQQAVLFSSLSGAVTILLLMFLILVRAISGSQAFVEAGLKGGRVGDWVVYGLAFTAFYGLSTALNALLGLGQAVTIPEVMASLGMPVQMSAGAFLAIMAVQTLLVGPLVGLPLGFGEEYGWRGYLQSALIKLGKKRGILLLGLIWGVWHYPVIVMGHNYPGQPLLGLLLMTGYTVTLAFILGYVMLKTGSIWLAAFLHAINNQANSFFQIMFFRADPVLSFGSGVFGILALAVIVLLLLRDPLWNDEPAAESQPEMEWQA